MGWGGLDWFGWVGLAQTRGKEKEATIGLLVMDRKEGWVEKPTINESLRMESNFDESKDLVIR